MHGWFDLSSKQTRDKLPSDEWENEYMVYIIIFKESNINGNELNPNSPTLSRIGPISEVNAIKFGLITVFLYNIVKQIEIDACMRWNWT